MKGLGMFGDMIAGGPRALPLEKSTGFVFREGDTGARRLAGWMVASAGAE